ncbi:GGDEF domain-containing protein [uncultured Psychromonas sp.]|uniref:EAL domain-containing protein n=1 Tax=uncultured Psychromonas sp. TaxID=173974 RepID=UPI00260367B6|nr:GGDEF domain-containing protein [uncultured Psychromonas sp.]
MNNFKHSLWASSLFFIILAVALTIATKAMFNANLIHQQQLLSGSEQLSALPDITSLNQLTEVIDIDKFSYIKISNDQLPSPLTLDHESGVNSFIPKLLPIAESLEVSTTTNQVIEYSAANNDLYQLYENIIYLMLGGLLLTFLFNNIIYFRLFNYIERMIVGEIINSKAKKSPLKTVSKHIEDKRHLFEIQLQLKEEKIIKLTSQATLDNLTGLNNRHAFRKELTQFLSDEYQQQHAILSIIRIFELSAVNITRGSQQGDEYILSIANIIRDVAAKFKNVNVFRISGSDFAVIAHNMSITNAQKFSNELKIRFDQYQSINELESVAFNGVTSISSNQLPEQVLARADIALAKAQISGSNAWAFEDSKSINQEFELGEKYWRAVIIDIMEKRSFSFLQQPVQAVHRNMKGYQEIFTRFLGDNDNTIPTSTVFSMAQRTDTIIKLEKIILEKVISNYHRKAKPNTRWGINVSSTAIQNSSFIIWLERLLLREPDIASSLFFEIQERLLDSNLASSKRFFDMLKRVGSHSVICNFGKGIGSFSLFKELKPDYIKIDASLVADLEHDSSNQQFIRMIIDVAQRMECQVIAEGIETPEQRQILESMYIDGVQGFLIARPTDL